MKAAVFDYQCPADLQEARQALQSADGLAKIMGGSQSLGPMLNLRLARPATVVDVSRLPELAQVRVEGSRIIVGGAVTHAAIEDGLHAPLQGHPMHEIAAGIAYRAVRNRGTLGGSLAHADPAADWIVTLTALDAQLTLSSAGGERNIAMRDFMQAAYTTALEAQEIIVSVSVPDARGGRWGYYKFCRKPGEFAEASAAVWQPPQGGAATLVLGALDGVPMQLPELALHIGREGSAAASRERIEQAIRTALPQRDAVDHRLHAVCLARALAQAGLA
ncbi:FAD binding domain-containing protein [Ottowia sp. VDI28]|uniref:FAD binding domain-containing protein n=1 Tax=Ottowia sp. VDI28 TaxID=3133968 RepID=UPI003C2BE851